MALEPFRVSQAGSAIDGFRIYADATLVCHRDQAQGVKELVTELHRQQMVESVHHTTVERPWGRYTVMDEGPNFKVKRIVVDPGQKLSLQVHQHRAEHWVVVTGTAQVTIGQEIRLVANNQSVYIPQKTPHRLENPTVEPIQLIEVQPGPTWKKTISNAWRMITGTRIRTKLKSVGRVSGAIFGA